MTGELKFGLFLLAACIGYFVLHSPRHAPQMTGVDVIARQWAYQAAREESQKTGKPVVLDFYADWCGPCRWMRDNTWSDPRVNQAMRSFVLMPVNVDENRELSKMFAVHGIPYVVVISPDGKILCSQTGALPPDRLLAWLPAVNHETASAQ